MKKPCFSCLVLTEKEMLPSPKKERAIQAALTKELMCEMRRYKRSHKELLK